MKKIFLILFTTLLLVGCTDMTDKKSREITLIPKPLNIEKAEGTFTLSKETSLYDMTGEMTDTELAVFTNQLKFFTGLEIKSDGTKGNPNQINLSYDKDIDQDEGYRLTILKDSISIFGKTTKGLFYGLQTLFQLLPKKEILSEDDSCEIEVQQLTIRDAPSLKWRGIMLDVSRHFFSVEDIKKQLDILSMYKVNKLHWHLTDDQGWRIEIKKYPKLAQVGGMRKEMDGSEYGGYYTQDDIKEVVAYAKDRQIDILPEIDIPGHSVALLSAYPQYSCKEGPFEVRNLWGIDENLLCIDNPKLYVFLEDIIKELVTLFPFEYIHLGGDETPTAVWKSSLGVQRLKKKLKLENEEELSAYFMSKMEVILNKYNRQLIGWDEILNGELSKTATIMSWRGEKGGIEAANKEHHVIMTPNNYVYFDYYQGSHTVEPIAIGGLVTLERVYNYNPFPAEVKENQHKYILGVQANLWTEYITSIDKLEYMLFPRAIALAEMTWTNDSLKSFQDFDKRLNENYVYLNKKKTNYHIPLPEGLPHKVAFIDSVYLNLTTTRPIELRYTTNGKDPDRTSKIYKDSLLFEEEGILKVASFLSYKMSDVVTIMVEKQELREPIELKSKKNGLRYREVKGLFGNVDEVNTEGLEDTKRITSLAEVNQALNWGIYIDPNNFSYKEVYGHIEIPKDGVYYFESVVDQVWVSDELVIGNQNEIKKHPVSGVIALKKGMHTLRLKYLNNQVGGWASDWNEIYLKYKTSLSDDYVEVPNTSYYQ